MAFAEAASNETHDEIVSFPTWRKVLEAQGLPEKVKRDFQRDIIGLLRACKDAHRPVSVGFIRWFLGRRGLTEVERQYERDALKWFFQEAKRVGGVVRQVGAFRPPVADVAALEAQPRRNAGVPPPVAASDLGQTDWERALVSAMRQRGFLWRTEQTYRGWAKQFADFVLPRAPMIADGGDVATFLTRLAVERRASVSSQKQALNALVFFMQEALRINLGEMQFAHARPHRKIPVVLSRTEITRLLAALSPGYRLMAELMYGAGLRLLELLRLRVHHLDLERGQVQVYSGKGGRVNGFANAVNARQAASDALHLRAAIGI